MAWRRGFPMRNRTERADDNALPFSDSIGSGLKRAFYEVFCRSHSWRYQFLRRLRHTKAVHPCVRKARDCLQFQKRSSVIGCVAVCFSGLEQVAGTYARAHGITRLIGIIAGGRTTKNRYIMGWECRRTSLTRRILSSFKMATVHLYRRMRYPTRYALACEDSPCHLLH